MFQQNKEIVYAVLDDSINNCGIADNNMLKFTHLYAKRIDTHKPLNDEKFCAQSPHRKASFNKVVIVNKTRIKMCVNLM